MISIKNNFKFRKHFVKICFPLFGCLLHFNAFANQLDAIAPNGVLIDSEGVLTALGQGISRPQWVVIGGNSYAVLNSQANPELSEVILFLDKPVIGVEPIPRYRGNMEKRLSENSKIYIPIISENPNFPTRVIDFSTEKGLGMHHMKWLSLAISGGPRKYPAMDFFGAGPVLVMGTGYFIKNGKDQFALVGMEALINKVANDGTKSLINGVEANTMIDCGIIRNALGVPPQQLPPQPQQPYAAPSPSLPHPTLPPSRPQPSAPGHVTIDPAKENLAVGSLVGLACGDALGITNEQGHSFKQTHLTHLNMVGKKGRFPYRPGDWSDDTSTALALTDSLIQNWGLIPKDVKDRFLNWHLNGTYDSQGNPNYGSGKNTRKELDYYNNHPSHIFATQPANNAGNGALMRECPVVIFYNHDYGSAIRAAVDQARLTHASPAAWEAAAMLADVLFRAFDFDPQTYQSLNPGKPVPTRKEYALNLINYLKRRSEAIPSLDNNIGRAQQDVLTLTGKQDSNQSWRKVDKQTFISNLKAKNAHVQNYAARSARDTLAIALWSVQHTNNFEDAITEAINMGGDTDTIGAVTGQIAGAIYGYNGIPDRWKNKLRSDRYDVAQMARILYQTAEQAYAAGKGYYKGSLASGQGE